MSAPHPLCVLYEIEYGKYCDAGCVWTRCLSRDQNSVSVLAFKNLAAPPWAISPGRATITSERFVPLIESKIQTQTPVAFREAAARHVPQTQFSLALGTVPRSSDFCKAAIAARQQKVPTNG